MSLCAGFRRWHIMQTTMFSGYRWRTLVANFAGTVSPHLSKSDPLPQKLKVSFFEPPLAPELQCWKGHHENRKNMQCIMPSTLKFGGGQGGLKENLL